MEEGNQQGRQASCVLRCLTDVIILLNFPREGSGQQHYHVNKFGHSVISLKGGTLREQSLVGWGISRNSLSAEACMGTTWTLLRFYVYLG